MMLALTIFLSLVFLHFLCDYPLQGDFLANGKNHTKPIPGVPWQIILASHAGIHAGAVLLATSSVTLALVEWVTHAFIDWLKCEGWFTRITCSQGRAFALDQALHLICKAVYVVVLLAYAGATGTRLP